MHANPAVPLRTPDERALTPIQFIALVLCFLVVAADGFDVASIGYVAPLIKRAWLLEAIELGPLFGAGLAGLAVGSFVFGPVADRIGRKRVIALSLLIFGAGSLACAFAPSLSMLIALRFITGAGLGGAMPNAITLSSEFSPARNRAWMVTLMFCGFTLGLALGGGIASVLIPSFGWKGVFVFGGAFPLFLAPVVWFGLPESLSFMAGKPQYAAEAARVARRLGVDALAYADAEATEGFDTAAARERVVSVLFSRHYRAGTLLIWLAFFSTLWVYYQITNWLPTVMTSSGIDVAHAARVGAMLPLGGTIGSLVNARLMDRANPFFVVMASYVIAALSIAVFGYVLGEATWVFVMAFLAGYGLSGAQTAANVLVAGFYTTGARATGVGWALGVGRIGSIIGSMSGGYFLAVLPSVRVAFAFFAVPAVIAAVAMFACGRLYGRGRTTPIAV